MLNTLFLQEITPDEKKEILNQKFDIATTAELESEVQGMCNLGSAIENKGKEIKLTNFDPLIVPSGSQLEL